MQKDPEKFVANYNEFYGAQPPVVVQYGTFQLLESGPRYTQEHQMIVQTGYRLVNNKIDTILGPNNSLTNGNVALPVVIFNETSGENANWAGYFSYRRNEIGINKDKIADTTESRTKVFIHEYIHFLSHNGHDESEQVDANTPLSRNNNVGFRRNAGLDIRRGREGSLTTNYFLAFNEAVTEQLAIDIMPGFHETYDDYRGLLNQVIDDAVTRELGAQNESGVFQPWSRDEVKNYIYLCFFKGNLEGFTGLLKNIYKKYDISEQEFGLMTHRNDLPSLVERRIRDDPKRPPPSPALVVARVRELINSKTADDYITDIIDPEPSDGGGDAELKYGTEYDKHIEEHSLKYSHREYIAGEQHDIDSFGYIIYHGDDAAKLLGGIKAELDKMLAQNIDASVISERMDVLLFETNVISMLSDGFRDFYIYKHSRIG